MQRASLILFSREVRKCKGFFQFDFLFYFMFEVADQVKGSIIYARDEELLTVMIVT